MPRCPSQGALIVWYRLAPYPLAYTPQIKQNAPLYTFSILLHTQTDTTSHTLGIQTEASSGNNRIEGSTFIAVVVVVIIVPLILYILTIGAVVIYYKNRLKTLKMKQKQNSTNQIV